MSEAGAYWLLFGSLVVATAAAVHLWRRARREAERLRRSLQTASQELERLQMSFAHFAPQEIVERIIASGVSTSAERKEVTLLFADLVGFTTLGESLEPEALVQILNGYFARMSRVITAHRGHVSKFIGDGIFAVFGALERNPWQANDAAHAALAMRAELAAYNQELAGRLTQPLRVGIGLHRGPVVAGIVGSNELMEFTVIGHSVNLASRVEGLTRRHGTDILITAAVRESLDERFLVRRLEPASVAGIPEPVVTYAVEGFRGD